MNILNVIKMKIKGKTSDGKRINDIVNTLMQLPNITLKAGKRHKYLLKNNSKPVYGNPGLCALGSSTSYRNHVLPWVKKVTGYDAIKINQAFQYGVWQ